MKTLTHSLRRAACVLLISFVACAAHASSTLLQDIDLPGTEGLVEWTNVSSTNSALTPSTGAGTLAPVSPGYKASMGFYSYMGHYSFTAGTTAGFDIANVVLQYTGGYNPDYSFDQYLAFNNTTPAALTAGPVLTYTYSGGTGTLTPTFSSVIGGPTTLFIEAMGSDVTFYTFGWQWDLSAVTETITGISITTNVPVHTSITGVQIALSDTFAGSAIPEPATYTAIAGAIILAAACLRRGKRTAA
ncbi:hypothetical protein [Rariglobus hedericola]|uniref:PEP-CTERM sorting domain-containing protein n=1 Tax=Rariglobus hedericola TaxID=2597822 RepID=A0A556QMC4_9BACT|nr:hypothetical protein [Rariglobus hedericola]TSJ77801.1 hypothetical protein FPL22_00410 [Rariglobus hedericola]